MVPGESYAPIPDLSFISAEQPAFALLEYCAVYPECFQTTRDRAVRYLSNIRAAQPDAPAETVALPADRRGIARLLLAELTLDGGDALPGFGETVAGLFPA
jgi:hypothetical protein